MDSELYMKILMFFPMYAVFLFSFVSHESAHAWMACRLGDGTSRYFISLNPLPHIRRTPFGMVLVPLLTYYLIGWPLGFASVPINMLWAQQNPRRYGLVALAGPLSNIIIATFFVIIWGLYNIFSGDLSLAQDGIPLPYELLRMAVNLNIVLAVFNFIPMPPLDGAAIPCLFIPKDHLRSYFNIIWNPSFAMPGILIAYFVFSGVFNVIGVPVLIFLDTLLNFISHF